MASGRWRLAYGQAWRENGGGGDNSGGNLETGESSGVRHQAARRKISIVGNA
jgi:hypothetical protein